MLLWQPAQTAGEEVGYEVEGEAEEVEVAVEEEAFEGLLGVEWWDVTAPCILRR